MLIAVSICVAVINFCPAYSDSDIVLRRKRSDDNYVPCERGWYYFREKCYKAGGRKASERLTWDKALERCRNYGGDLVSIQSQEEQDFVVSFLLLDIKFWAWIGLSDHVNESEYVWTDGSVFNYTNWNVMEPTGLKDEREDCVHMVFEPENNIIGKWNDKSCDATDAYICEMNANSKQKSPNQMYCSSKAGEGWKFQNSCFYVATEMKSWENAEKHCKENYNGHLVTILNILEDLFLDHILANMRKEFWIGIKIQDQLQQKWTSGWYVSYNGFNKEQLNFIEGTCAAKKQRKEWVTIACTKRLSFICKTSKVNPPVLKFSARGSHCPIELDDWRDLGGEYCYYIQTENSINFYEASFDCKRRGGDLVSLHSKEEANILLPFVKYVRQSIYIGLIRLLTQEEEFAWSDGSVMNYENWNHNEPNNEEEKCGEALTQDMTWNDCSCEDKKGYICSVKKTGSHTEPPHLMQHVDVVSALRLLVQQNISPNSTSVEENSCTSQVSLKAWIGVSVCVLLVIILLSIVLYYFRPCSPENRKNSTAASTTPPTPLTNRPRYRSTTELRQKDDENYEMMM